MFMLIVGLDTRNIHTTHGTDGSWYLAGISAVHTLHTEQTVVGTWLGYLQVSASLRRCVKRRQSSH